MAVNIKKEIKSLRKPDVSSLIYGKIPPQAVEIEAAVLGAILLEKDKLQDVLEIIPSPDCFYTDVHQKVYAAVQAVYSSGSAVDMLTVIQELMKAGELENVGGAFAITRLTQSVVSSAHADAHARIVMEKWISRETIRICGNAISVAYDDSNDCFDTVDGLEAELQALTNVVEGSGQTTCLTSGQVATKTVKALIEMQGRKEGIAGIPTGFVDLDTATYGWQKTDLVILGARPRMGKTALALHWMLTAAKANVWVLFISMEMSSEQLGKRVLSNLSGVDFGKVMSGRMDAAEMERIGIASQQFAKMPITIEEKSAIHKEQLRRIFKRWNERRIRAGAEGLGIIDYLQLMEATRTPGMSTNDVVSAKSGALKSMAKDFEIPIIALSQLNREAEKKGSAPPQLSDLRDSGSIEQDANMVMFLQHDKGTQIHLAKNRNGKEDVINVKFMGEYQRFSEVHEFLEIANFKPMSAVIGAAGRQIIDEPF